MITKILYAALNAAMACKASIKRRNFECGAALGDNVEISHSASLTNLNDDKDCVHIGNFASIHGSITCEVGAKVSIGEYSTIRFGSVIGAATCVDIGNFVMISHDVYIYDNNNHPISPMARHTLLEKRFRADLNSWLNSERAAVRIEDDVWVGFNCIILKGATIGRGSIIGAGSVVTGSIPPFCVAAGNPARVVKKLYDDLEYVVFPAGG